MGLLRFSSPPLTASENSSGDRQRFRFGIRWDASQSPVRTRAACGSIETALTGVSAGVVSRVCAAAAVRAPLDIEPTTIIETIQPVGTDCWDAIWRWLDAIPAVLVTEICMLGGGDRAAHALGI